jgi:hypothetical protein
MKIQISWTWLLKGPQQLGTQICSNSHLFYSKQNLKPYALACNG